MNDTQLTAIIIGLTGIIRTRFPKIDGVVVPAVAVGLGGALSALADPVNWRLSLFHGVAIALTAVGGMTAIGYAGTKVGEAIGNANAAGADDASATGELPSAPSPTSKPVTSAPTPAPSAAPPAPATSNAPATPAGG